MAEDVIVLLELGKYDVFNGGRVDLALKKLLTAGCEPVFMPELVDARINAEAKSRVWQERCNYTTPSLIATGNSKGGNPVVVYAHVLNYFSVPENITNIIRAMPSNSAGLLPGAGILPEEEFQRLLGLEDDKRVFVVDYNRLKGPQFSVMSVDEALEHPQTIPFFGGEQKAKAYLKKYKEIYGNEICMWYDPDDLREQPVGRFLSLGDRDRNICGFSHLHDSAYFVGVSKIAEGDAQKNRLSLDDTVLEALRTKRAFEFEGQFYIPISKQSGIKLE